MRQTHVGGDKLFVDYAGDAVPVIIDRLWAWCAAPICRAGKQPCAATLADNGSGSLPHEVAHTVRSPFRRYPKSYLEGGWVLASGDDNHPVRRPCEFHPALLCPRRLVTATLAAHVAVPGRAKIGDLQGNLLARGLGAMQSNLSQFQRRQFAVLRRVSPFSITGHLVNTTVAALALAGSVPRTQLIIWCIYSYSIALLLLYRHLKNRGRSPRNFQRAAKKVMTYSFFMALPWSSLAVLHLGALSHDQELIIVALTAGMAATGTILLSALPPAAFIYMSAILIPSALKCVVLNQKGYLLLGALALSCWGFLAALIAKIARDAGERERTEQSLAEYSVQRALAERAALVGSFAYDTHTDRMEISPGCAAIHGFPEETAEISRGEWLSRLHPEDAARLQVLRSRAFSDRRREYNADYRVLRSGGEVRWIDARSFVEYDNDGYARRVIGVNIDITERKQAEEHRKFLNAELDHRVKNALATVSAVVSHTLEGRSSLGDFAAALEGRIRSMATAHELLSSRRWQGIPLRELVRRELAPYSTSNNTEIDGPEVLLEPQAGQAMATVLHELVINAAKYGALSVPSGQVSVSWSHRPNGRAQSWLCIHWQERGGPSVVQQIQSGYGTSVIREMIPYSLRGTVDLVHAPDGVRCNMGISERWLIGGAKPAIIPPVDATPPFSSEFERPTAPTC